MKKKNKKAPKTAKKKAALMHLVPKTMEAKKPPKAKADVAAPASVADEGRCTPVPKRQTIECRLGKGAGSTKCFSWKDIGFEAADKLAKGWLAAKRAAA